MVAVVQVAPAVQLVVEQTTIHVCPTPPHNLPAANNKNKISLSQRTIVLARDLAVAKRNDS
jgi:hypothetical protein